MPFRERLKFSKRALRAALGKDFELRSSSRLDCIDDEDTADEMREECKHLGRALLILIESKRVAAIADSNNYGADIADEYDAIVKAGVAAPKVASFNAFKSETNKLRKLLVGTDDAISDRKYSSQLARR